MNNVRRRLSPTTLGGLVPRKVTMSDIKPEICNFMPRTTFSAMELLLPYMKFTELCDDRKMFARSLREWIAAWELYDLFYSPMDDDQRRFIRLGHYLGWYEFDKRYTYYMYCPSCNQPKLRQVSSLECWELSNHIKNDWNLVNNPFADNVVFVLCEKCGYFYTLSGYHKNGEGEPNIILNAIDEAKKKMLKDEQIP